MIDITQIFFFEDNKEHNNRRELSIIARNTIQDEIQNTKMRNDFYRYLSWRIQTAPLKKKIMHRYKNFYITTFTNESWILIEKFVDYAVEVFNLTHPSTKTTVGSTIIVLEEWWDYDYEEYLWDEEVKQYDVETSGEICLLDKDNMTTKSQSHHNACVDYYDGVPI
jgi:hypothetical protein